MRRGLVTGTILSLIVVGAWSVMGTATMSPVPPLHLDWRRHPVAAYGALASAPTGNGWDLFAVLSVIYMLALLRALRRREAAERASDEQA